LADSTNIVLLPKLSSLHSNSSRDDVVIQRIAFTDSSSSVRPADRSFFKDISNGFLSAENEILMMTDSSVPSPATLTLLLINSLFFAIIRKHQHSNY
jgi:hypothetical protein